jgi:hypothetical protein
MSSRHLLPALIWVSSQIVISVIASEGPQHGLESLQPSGILMAIAYDDLGALWGRHGVSPLTHAGIAVNLVSNASLRAILVDQCAREQ